MFGRSGRGLCSSHAGTCEQASRARGAKTVSLPSLIRPSRLGVGLGGRHSSAQVLETTEARNENADAPLLQAHRGTSTKRSTEETLVKPRRRRAKIQRVQLGGGLPSSSADQPLSDADHHLNSQPDAADHGLEVDALNAADESEISYFPTLRPALPSSDAMQTDGDEADDHAMAMQQDTSGQPTLQTGPTFSVTVTSHKSRHKASDPQHVTLERADEQPEDGDPSTGLLEVLSQSAMRKLDAVQEAQAVSIRHTQPITSVADVVPVHPLADVESQHQVQVDFDHTHFTDIQAQRIANSIVTSKCRSKRWSSVHSNFDAVPMHPPGSQKVLQAAFQPPSIRAVCRDLGLTSSQMRKRPIDNVPDFVHQRSIAFNDGLHSDENHSLESFEHDLHFAGYRQARKSQLRAQGKSTELPSLQPFNESKFQQRSQTRQKEVVKVIIPFSEPSLSPHATRARFITPNPTSLPPRHRPHPQPAKDAALLIWMQSTAYSFFRALETMLQAGFSPPAHDSSSSHRTDAHQPHLYPCPILHYAAHADTTPCSDWRKAPSHVALYVHLDRLEEARLTLATMELGGGGGGGADGGYRPFSDPSVRLLVTSVQGEPLCLI